ncbi:MAG: iron ABC transporter permease [Nocardioides sp.]
MTTLANGGPEVSGGHRQPWWRRLPGRATGLMGGLVVLAVSALILAPVVIVVLASISRPVNGFVGNYTLANIKEVLTAGSARPVLWDTLIFTACATLLAVALASLLAWIATATDVPFRRVVRLIPLAPLLIPPLLRDTSWVQLYSPRTGLVNLGFQKVFHTEHVLFDVFGMKGMIVDVGLNMVPIAYLILQGAFTSLNRSVEEASRLSGAGTWRTLRRVTLPLVTPALLSAFALVAMVVAASFETPIIIGRPGGVNTYMSEIFASLSGSGVPDYNLAAAQSDVYFVLNGLLLAWYLLATRREQRFQTVTGRGYNVAPTDTGRPWWRRSLLLVVPVVYFVLAFGQLFVQGVLVSLSPFYTTTQGFPFKHLTFDNYTRLFHQSTTSDAIFNSLRLSILATVLTVAVAILLGAVAFQTKIRGRRAVEMIGTLPIAIPPLVFSVALLITVLMTPVLRGQYGGFLPLVVVDMVVFLPFAVRIISASMLQISPELREAASISGAGLLRRLLTVTVPLVRVAVFNAGLIVFVSSFRELAGVALLTGPDTPLVPTAALNLYFVGQAPLVSSLNVITAVIPILMVGVVAGLLAATRLVRRRRQPWRLSVVRASPLAMNPLPSSEEPA